MFGKPDWLIKLEQKYPTVLEVHKFDIAKDELECLSSVEDVKYVIHMASVASPSFYRKYPLETIDGNISGLRRLFEFFEKSNVLDGFLFFSSSEIYGDPARDQIPTPEDYRGNVSCIGPRSCYDEAKRLGETLCYIYGEKMGLPVIVARPFNNYGPGMRINDKRLPADFANSILSGKRYHNILRWKAY